MQKIFKMAIFWLTTYGCFSVCIYGYAYADATHKHVTVAAMVYGNHNVVTFDGFKAGMKEKGYIEGKNIAYIFEGAYKKKEKLDAGIEKLVAENPDLIFTATTPATLAAKKATSKKKIPVVFGPVNDPVRAGIIDVLHQPGDNITGVMLTDSTAKQLEWVTRVVPDIKNVFLPYNPLDKSSLISYKKVKAAAQLFKINLTTMKVHSHNEIDSLLENFPDNMNSIFLPRDGMIMSRVKDFAKVAQKKKLALSGTRLEMAEKGALFGFGFNGFELGKQMSRLADQVLHGIDPGKLPVETAEDYLAINLKAARKMGITIPERILRQAHIIIR